MSGRFGGNRGRGGGVGGGRPNPNNGGYGNGNFTSFENQGFGGGYGGVAMGGGFGGNIGSGPRGGGMGGGGMRGPPSKETTPVGDITTTLGKRPAFKLRKAIHPKSPLLIINEMLAGKKTVRYENYEVPIRERERRAWYHGIDLDRVGEFDCVAVVGEDRYSGDGLSKNDARSMAAERAIQGEILQRCEQNSSVNKKLATEDYCPWAIIASLSLYKMYEQWQQQGYIMPKELTDLPNANTVVKIAPPGTNQNNPLAGTWMDKDDPDKPPLARVNEMIARSGISSNFTQTDETDISGTKMFTWELQINNKYTYKASAKSKKQAKHECALKAINEQDKWYNPKTKLTREQKDAQKAAERAAVPPGEDNVAQDMDLGQ